MVVAVKRNAHLPLGVDIGTSRIRLALAERDRSAGVRLAAVVTRDLPEGIVRPEAIDEPSVVAAIVDDLHRELCVRERRCVFALSSAVASVRTLQLPKMSEGERRRAARFEAERSSPAQPEGEEERVVRVHAVDRSRDLYGIGIAQRVAIVSRAGCLRAAGLRPIAGDHEACALSRAFPLADAVLDVGLRFATLHAFTPGGPVSQRIVGGGEAMTRAIAADLGLEFAVAEKRKRILGTAGAGEIARAKFVANVETAVARVRERTPIRRIATCGNGARLPGLSEALEAATGAIVELGVSEGLRGGAYPDDVVRAAAPDWALAVSLAAWNA